MSDSLPRYIDPNNLADKRGEAKGEYELKYFERLGDLLFNTNGSVAIDLYFSREGRLAKIEGKIETNLILICQNCLAGVDWPVRAAVRLGIVNSLDQVDRLPEHFEPLYLDDEKIRLIDIVEDEILLNLPQFPKHSEACAASIANISPERQTEAIPKRQDNPFSILSQLLNNSESPHGSTKK